MKNRKFYTCCFTGHRPSNLPWGYNEKGVKFFIFKLRLYNKIIRAINSGYIHFISGMALGIDMICAEIVLNLKKRYPNITLECAIPCTNQAEKWTNYSIVKYNNILSKADTITYVSSRKYYKGCMHNRNKYMIDNSNLLIAIYNGSNGGTKQTIQYAKSNNLNISLIKLKK